jgi:hypothetical protein
MSYFSERTQPENNVELQSAPGPEMKLLPAERREVARALARRHADRGWRHIMIGLPSRQESLVPGISFHATAPDGHRIQCLTTLDDAGFASLDKYLHSYGSD